MNVGLVDSSEWPEIGGRASDLALGFSLAHSKRCSADARDARKSKLSGHDVQASRRRLSVLCLREKSAAILFGPLIGIELISERGIAGTDEDITSMPPEEWESWKRRCTYCLGLQTEV
jgi:hypothetical protein